MTVISKQIDVKPTLGRIAMLGLPAIIIAVGINAILFLIGWLFSAFPPDALTPMNTPIQFLPVVMMTLVGGIIAAVGYFVLTRLLTVKKAKLAMWGLGILILALMFFTPLRVENLPTFGIVLLEIMHLVAGLLPIGRLTSS